MVRKPVINRLDGMTSHSTPEHAKPVNGVPELRTTEGFCVMLLRTYRVKLQTCLLHRISEHRIRQNFNIMPSDLHRSANRQKRMYVTGTAECR